MMRLRANKAIRANDLYTYSLKHDEKAVFSGRDFFVSFICTPTDACENAIIWVRSKDDINKNTLDIISSTKELLIICANETKEFFDNNSIRECSYIVSACPRDTFFSIIDQVGGIENDPFIDWDNSVIKTDRIGSNVSIGANCFIGRDVIIGDNVTIHNNVSIECPTIIGENTTIFSGAVIGASGYGYYNDKNIKKRIPHLKGVVIGKNVDIGANTCIDRGCLSDTIIGDHVKIDNLVHVAHNVKIDDNCMIVAQAMLGGSSQYGKGTYIAPGGRVFDQVKLGENVIVGVGAVVKNDVGEGKTVVGIPAREIVRG